LPDVSDEVIVLTVQELSYLLDGSDLWRNRLSRHKEVAQAYKAHIFDLKGQIKLLRYRLFGRKSEQTAQPNTPQLELFNEPESELMPSIGDAAEEVVSLVSRRGKRKSLSAELPCVEVIYELPEHELTCACGCRKHVINEEIGKQPNIMPMQIRVIKHICTVYGCRGCETAPVTADKPAQLIEKSMASPSVLAMLLTTKSVDGLLLYRFETVLSRYGIDIPRQTLARWVMQCSGHFQPLLNLMRDRLMEGRVIHFDETRVQVLKEPGRDPTSQSWMCVQTSGPPDRKVVLFDYRSSRAQEVPLRLLEGYRGYVMTDDYAGYNALALQPGVERLACMAHAGRNFVEAQKVQPKGRTGRADIVLAMIKKPYGIELELKDGYDRQRLIVVDY
jgi:transposase